MVSKPRVLVCGGRDYTDYAKMNKLLSETHAMKPFGCVIHGRARGADSLADRWAKEHDVPVAAYPADWEKDGKRAGPLRNQRMLDKGKPHVVVAFPGGNGTNDMVRRARDAGVPVLEVT